MFGLEPLFVGVGGFVFIALTFFGALTAMFYQKCGPNQAMIISGLRHGARRYRIVAGGGGVLIPFFQQRSDLSLEVMTIEVHSQAPMITKTGVPIFVEGVAQVKVKGDEDSIATAAEQFLGKTNEEIATIAHETLVGHLRAILGTMTVEELIQSFDSFAQRVQEVSIGDLAKMGLTVVSFTIKEIKDEVGYLDSLGKQRTAEAKRSADIGVAFASKETQIAQAQAQRDAAIAQAQATEEGAKAKLMADTRVAEASKNFQVNQATYVGEVSQQKASTDMMYDIVKAQSQQKLVEETQQIKIVEAQKEVELQEVEVQRRQVQLTAEVTKPAEAELSRIKLMAQADQEKRRMLAEAEALATKLQAQAAAEATRLKSMAEAEAAKVVGIAQAEALKAKGLAEAAVIEAKGQAEANAMTNKAEAYKQYNEAAMASMIVDRLPEMVQAAAGPLSKIGQMTVLSTSGDGTGASKITGDVMNVAAQSLSMIKGLTGIDVAQAIKNADGKKSNGSTDEKPNKS